MRYTPATMLRDIERNLDFVPHKERSALEPLIGAMNAGQVTALSDDDRATIHRTHILHCLSLADV